jgi:hypothetical protein
VRQVGLAVLALGVFAAWGLVNLLAYIAVASILLRGQASAASDMGWPLAGLFLLFFIATYSVILNFVLKKAFR